MVSKKHVKFFFSFPLLGKTDMQLGKRWLLLIGNGAQIRPLEKGRKSPAKYLENLPSMQRVNMKAIRASLVEESNEKYCFTSSCHWRSDN